MSASQAEGRRFEPGLALQISLSFPIACAIASSGPGGLFRRGAVWVPFGAAEVGKGHGGTCHNIPTRASRLRAYRKKPAYGAPAGTCHPIPTRTCRQNPAYTSYPRRERAVERGRCAPLAVTGAPIAVFPPYPARCEMMTPPVEEALVAGRQGSSLDWLGLQFLAWWRHCAAGECS